MNLYQGLRLRLNPMAPDVVAMVGGGGKSSTAFRLAAEIAASGRRAVIAPSTRIAAFQTAWAPAFLEVNGTSIPWDALERELDHHGYCLLGGPVAGDRRLGLEALQIDALMARAAALQIAAITIEADGSKMRPVKAPADHEPVLPASTTHLAPVVGLDAVGALLDERTVHRPELVRRVLGLEATATPRLTPAMLAQLLRDPAGGAKGAQPTMRLAPILNKADSPLRLIYGRLIAARLAQQGVPALVASVGIADQPPVIERWGQSAIIVLAAGGSRRLGRPKQFERVEGEPMIVRAMRTAVQSGIGPVFVVTGAEAEGVRTALSAWQKKITFVHNAAWQTGQASSVSAALAALPAAVESATFVPVDQPLLDPLLLRRLHRAWREGADLAAPQVAGAMRGAPALFDRRFWPDLLRLEGDVGGRRVLAAHQRDVVTVLADEGWLCDIDTQEDLAAIHAR